MDHTTIVQTIFSLGIPGWLVNIVSSYLEKRKLQVQYKGETSEKAELPDRQELIETYIKQIRPQVEIAVPYWGTKYESNLLERVQKTAQHVRGTLGMLL